VKRTNGLMMILMVSCVTFAGCGTLKGLLPSEKTEPPSITQCPVRPELYATKTEDGAFYILDRRDVQALLHYVVELEYSAGCR